MELKLTYLQAVTQYEGGPESIQPFEYLDNRSYGLDVTWQPVRGDLTVHPWTVTLPWD